MHARFVISAMSVGFMIVAGGCSLFVSLDGLADGDGGPSSASDASSDQLVSNADSATDAPTTGSGDASTYASVILADHPLVFLPLDETTGSRLYDSSGNGNDGISPTVLLGGLGAFTGSGTSAHFGGNAIVTIPTSVDDAGTPFDFTGNTSFSLEAWVKLDYQPDNSKGQEFTFFSKEQNVGGDNFHGFDFLDRTPVHLQREDDPTDDTEAVASAGAPDATAWHYLVGTYDGSTIEIYVDNVLVGTKAGSMTMLPVTSVPFLLGAEDTSGDNALFGSMDEVAVYKTALTLTQRTAHFNAAGH